MARDGSCLKLLVCRSRARPSLKPSRAGSSVLLRGWMFGDSLELDVPGGAVVGLGTAWLDDGSDPTGFHPDLVADSVAAAVRAILHGPVERHPSLPSGLSRLVRMHLRKVVARRTLLR